MRSFARALFVCSVVVPFSAAFASEFVPNHLFVACANSNLIVEFDEDGQFVRNIAPPGIDSPQSLAFGPNGLLYATSLGTHELFEIQPDGQVSAKLKLGNSVGPNAVRVGPNGHLFVNGSLDHIMHRVEVLDGPIHDNGSFPLVTQSLADFEFTSTGSFVGVATNLGLLYEINLQGNQIRSTSITSTPSPSGIAIGPFDLVWYSSLGMNAITRTQPYLTVIDTFPLPDLASPTGMVCGPNGNLFICSNANDRVVEFSPFDFQVKGAVGFNVPTLDGPYGIAFAPYRFKAKIKGRIADYTGTESTDDDAVLSIAPGSRTIMVQFNGGIGTSSVVTKFFEHAFVFHGTEVENSSTKRLLRARSKITPHFGRPSSPLAALLLLTVSPNTLRRRALPATTIARPKWELISERALNGEQVGSNPGQGTGRIDLEIKVSKDGALDFLKVKKASGRIARSNALSTFFGEIKAGELLD